MLVTPRPTFCRHAANQSAINNNNNVKKKSLRLCIAKYIDNCLPDMRPPAFGDINHRTLINPPPIAGATEHKRLLLWNIAKFYELSLTPFVQFSFAFDVRLSLCLTKPTLTQESRTGIGIATDRHKHTSSVAIVLHNFQTSCLPCCPPLPRNYYKHYSSPDILAGSRRKLT